MGKWSGAARLSTCPQGIGRSRRSGSRGLPGWGFDGLAVGGVAGEASRPVEEGECAVGILVHPDPCLDVVVSMAVGWDLQGQPAIAHGVVVADDTVCVDAEDVVERACEGHEGGALALGRGGEAGVVERQVDLLEEAVGLGHVGDAGEPEFLGQALLQGAEHALGPPPGLGRVGRDQLDAELHQGAADLGHLVFVDFAAGLGRVPVVRGAVGVERAEQPFGRDHLGQRPEARHRALLVDEEGRVDRAGGVIHGHDQVPPAAADPLMPRAVLVHHHARQRAARAPATVGAAPGCLGHQACALHGGLGPGVAPGEAVVGAEMVVEVLDRPAHMAGSVLLEHPGHPDRHGTRRADALSSLRSNNPSRPSSS